VVWFLRPKIEGRYLDSGNATNMFLIQLCGSVDEFKTESIGVQELRGSVNEFKTESIGVQELGLPKIGRNRNQVISETGDLTSKMAMFGGYLQNVPQKIRNFVCRRHWTLSQDQCDPGHAVSQLGFFLKKKQGVTLLLLNRCICGQKWWGKIHFEKKSSLLFIYFRQV